MSDEFSPVAHVGVELHRREHYDRISEEVESRGLNLDLFFNNPSYFGADREGHRIALTGNHPTLIHWPLDAYFGGDSLVKSLRREVGVVADLAGEAVVAWVRQPYWHCTVFSPVHSSDPQVIARSRTDISAEVRRELRATIPYVLNFTRVLILPNGGIKAVGYAHSRELDELRGRLRRAIPEGDSSQLIHITLGSFLTKPSPKCLAALWEYVRRWRTDQSSLGQIVVNFLNYAEYLGPFTNMKVCEIYREPLGGGETRLASLESLGDPS